MEQGGRAPGQQKGGVGIFKDWTFGSYAYGALFCTDFITDCVPNNYRMNVSDTKRGQHVEGRAKTFLEHKYLWKTCKNVENPVCQWPKRTLNYIELLPQSYSISLFLYNLFL